MRGPEESEKKISLVVGLGNPGKAYRNTRHNAGFLVVDRLAAACSIGLKESKFRAEWGDGMIGGGKVHLLKPATYMNLSGEAVAEFMRYFGLSADRILVVHDDLDLSCGRIRLARGGGAGGHRGVTSIIGRLGPDFPRLKLGIGRPLRGEPVEAYVLQPPYTDDVRVFEDMIAQGVDAVVAVLSCGLDEAMNTYNRRPE